MAAMVGARRALLAARYSPRRALTAALVSPARRADSPPSLPAERDSLRSLVPHRGTGSLASERIDGDYRREWGTHNAGNYGESSSKRPTDHLNHQVQRDLPSAGSSTGVDRNRGVHVGGSTNAHYRRNPEQPFQTGGSYGLPDSRQPCSGAKVNNKTPGYNARQPYGSSTAYNPQSPKEDIPNARQQHNGTQANDDFSGYGKVQTYHHSYGYDTYRFGYNNPSNQQSYTSGQYGYGPSGQSYQNSTGNYQNKGVHVGGSANAHYGRNAEQPYQSAGSYGLSNSRQPYTGARVSNETPGYDARQPCGSSSTYNHESPGGNYTNRPGTSASQYPNPSGFHKEHVAGFQQGHNGDFGYNASRAYQSPYVTSKVDTHRNHPGYSINVNADVQRDPHGIYQEKHSDIQPIASAGNNLNGTPYQHGIYLHHSLPGSPSNDGVLSEVSDEASGKSKGTVEELEKLCEDGKVKEALEVLALLQEKGILLHAPQYFKLMQACGDASALAEAGEIHNQISQSELAVDTDVNNKILEMYAKCGSMEDAKKLFGNMAQHDLTSWNTMISGFVHNGLGEEATEFFYQFKQTGDKPDPGMFTDVFLACGILGSVDEGMLHFESMQKDFGITPTMEHYASIVNMLGQSGYIDEAREFVERVPVEPSIDVWESLMNMCRLNGFLEIGDRCAQIVARLDPSRLNEQSKVGLFPVNASDLAKEKERKKANPVEARSKVHEYRAGDRSHPEHLKIYEELRYLAAHMKEAGYIADTRFVLHDVDQETKEDALLAHSERLAVSYVLITSAVRQPIRIIKNLRSCGDCHTAFKIISKLVGRQIIARDAKRFHHFENGVCSCKDYW